MPDYPFLKGHGTENDFVLLPDHDGSVHEDLSAGRVRALCDRHAGIGGDGVLRVIRTSAIEAGRGQDAEWFMDYRNSDGSVSEMCGNGVRVFALHLIQEGLVDPTGEFDVATRDGLKTVSPETDGEFSVDMGQVRVLGRTKIMVGDRTWEATHVDAGNPHAVVFVDDLAEAGSLLNAPTHDTDLYPDGVNVEFVVRLEERGLAMRVHERGSGETRSCGTGAVAVHAAAAVDDYGRDGARQTTYGIDVPGGHLVTTWMDNDRISLAGPALIVARGTTSL